MLHCDRSAESTMYRHSMVPTYWHGKMGFVDCDFDSCCNRLYFDSPQFILFLIIIIVLTQCPLILHVVSYQLPLFVSFYHPC